MAKAQQLGRDRSRTRSSIASKGSEDVLEVGNRRDCVVGLAVVRSRQLAHSITIANKQGAFAREDAQTGEGPMDVSRGEVV